VHLDGQSLPPGVPSYGTVPIWLGKKGNKIASNEAHLFLSDFGRAFSPFDSQQKLNGDQCCSPLPVLPPEAYFEPDRPISFPADIWTLACAVWAIFSSCPLFDATLAPHDDISFQQVEILGPLPSEWWDRWEARYEYFDETGRPKNDRFVVPTLEDCFEQEIQVPRQNNDMGQFDKEERLSLLSMLRLMLAFRPEERATATAVLGSKWMMTWNFPTLEKLRKAQ
jgi:serine/threonine-protein kinase SRPK3